MSKQSFIFFGTPNVASLTLEILKQNDFLPDLIITAPDRPAGRKMLITPPPVKVWAIENNIPYIQPEKITLEQIHTALETLGSRDGDEQRKSSTEDFCGLESSVNLFIVVAYGKILSEELIKLPSLGSINIHYSLLPKYRGASPVESAILNGEKETGISIQQMEYKMDSGPIIAEEKINIEKDENTIDLKERLINIGGKLLVQNLPNIFNQNIKLTPQDETGATFCKKIKKEDGLIDISDYESWSKEKHKETYNKYRAYISWPRTFFFQDGKRNIISLAIFENEKFIIKKIIPEGKKEQDFKK